MQNDIIKLNEVVYQKENLPAFLYKGTVLSHEKIKYYRETYPELKEAAIDEIGRKHVELIKEKLLVNGSGLDKRKRIAGFYK